MTGPSDSLAVPFSPQSGSGLNPILAFRGTVSLSNLLTDVRQLFGADTGAFEWASRTARSWIATNPSGRFAGHSLGGGLASVAALVTNHGATTINALGVHENTLARAEVTSAAAGRLIDAFYVRGEAVSLVQDGSGLPDALGTRIPVEPVRAGLPFYGPVQYHFGEWALPALGAYHP